MDCVLYKKNIPILRFIQYAEKNITSIPKIFNELHIPPHLFLNGVVDARNEYALCQKLEEFFNNRIIPYTRRSFKDMLTELEISSAEELAEKSLPAMSRMALI